jgi:L-threonylcarbamoyladenylate synthase
MGSPAIFLDRDGTLIEDRGHLKDPSEVAFLPGVLSALRRLKDQFVLFLITNQNGVALGKIELEDAHRVNDHVARRLNEAGIPLRAIYCCPHQRSDGCLCIKPNPYFPRKAEKEHGVDLGRSFVVGDHPSDVELAANVGARGLYVLSGHGQKHRHELKVACQVVPGLAEAAEAILAARAAELLRAGKLVAFPTETVYGLGADAMNEDAVRRLFEVKGRPVGHPLIVHLAGAGAIGRWSDGRSELAGKLAERFWPGPLTLILRKSPAVSLRVTGGQDTVGLRVPAHPLALAMLGEFGGGVAAPSANRFGRVSPTTALHVRNDLGSDVDFVLDGGPCTVGVESTILDLSGNAPEILRPGGVTPEEIEAVIGRPVGRRGASAVRAPGQFESHYAPRARVIVVEPDDLAAQASEWRSKGAQVFVVERPEAQSLYAQLREADAAGAEVILVVAPSETGLGLAVADRLRKAAGPRPGREGPGRSAGSPGSGEGPKTLNDRENGGVA